MYTTTLVSSKTEIEQIIALSSLNRKGVVLDKEKPTEGFITWEYSFELLQKMNIIAPSVIVKYNDQVVGYALAALKDVAPFHPDLSIMINKLDSISYKNKSLMYYKYYIMGQVCIAKEHRNKGLFSKMYQFHKKIYQNDFELLLTEISISNPRSLNAHIKVGFKIIHTFQDKLDEWNVVLWDWK